MSNKNTAFVQTLEKGLQILEYLVINKSVTVTNLARYMGIQKSSSYRFLNTLRLYGYVDQDENSNYTLTDKVSQLGLGIVPPMDFVKIATQFMNELFKKNKNPNGVCNLAKWNGKEMVYTVQLGHHYEQFRVGQTLPAYCSSLGRSVLGYLPEEELENYIAKTEFIMYTGHTVDSRERLMEELEFLRKHGYSMMYDELAPGLKSIAMPIIIKGRPVEYAISVSHGYHGNMDKILNEMLEPLQETVSNIIDYVEHNNIRY